MILSKFLSGVLAALIGFQIMGQAPAAFAEARIERLTGGSELHTINGIALAPDGTLVLTSVWSESIHRFDPTTGDISLLVAPGLGRSDDAAFSASGEMFWTDPLSGAVRSIDANGKIRDVTTNMPGANSIAFSRDGNRLFIGQTFFDDDLWEVDPNGVNPPRLVVANTHGVNAFAFGPDGMIYGPVTRKDSLVRIDPESGALTVIATDLHHPVSARFDSKGQLYVLNGVDGSVVRINPETAETKLIATTSPAMDNMIINRNDIAYLANMADNAVVAVDLTSGSVRTLTTSKLAFATDIDTFRSESGDQIIVTDRTALRSVDSATGEVREIARRMTSPLLFPSAIDVEGTRAVIVSELLTDRASSFVQLLDLSSGEFLETIDNLDVPTDALLMPTGEIVVAQARSGSLLRINGNDRHVLTTGLGIPTSLAKGPNNTVYVAEAGSNRLLAISLVDGVVTEVASGLDAPRSIAVAPDGSVVVLSGAGEVYMVNVANGEVELVASGLAVGFLSEPYPRSGGVSVGSKGEIFVAADRESAIYRLLLNR